MEIPKFLIERYQFWKKNTFEDYKGIYQQASKTPQKPIAMIITCCDSRILENTIFGGSVGDYFIHRTGHGLGLEIHEEPNIKQNEDFIRFVY